MRRLPDLLLICAYLLVALLPFLAKRLHVEDRHVEGVYVHPERPKLTAKAVWTEEFQHGYTAWFEDRLGLKGYSIHVDNSIMFHVFGETKPGSHVRVGRNDVLFQPDDIYFFTKYADQLRPTADEIEAFVARLARLQRTLQASGRALVPVVIPSKTTVFRGDVSDVWDRDVGDPRPTDDRIYRAFMAALARHGVVFVDARAMLTAPGMDRDLVWGRQARHWSYYATCLAMREVAASYRRLTGKPLAEYPCDYVTRTDVPIYHDDYDLLRLLNTFGTPRAPEPVPAIKLPSHPPASADRPRTLLVGSSFSWMMFRDAQRSGVFGKLHFSYYSNRMYDWPLERPAANPWELQAGDAFPPTDPRWRPVISDEDLYILDLFESYLIVGTYSSEFLDELERTLPPPAP